MTDKIYASPEAALDGILFDGMTIMSGGFGLCGIPEALIAAHGLGPHVTLTGWLDEAGVRGKLADSHALVLPSFAEGLPMVVMEAMAQGRPALATAIAGVGGAGGNGGKGGDIIFEAGISAPVRTPRGRDILAACGQLKSETEKLSARARLMLEQDQAGESAGREAVRERFSSGDSRSSDGGQTYGERAGETWDAENDWNPFNGI